SSNSRTARRTRRLYASFGRELRFKSSLNGDVSPPASGGSVTRLRGTRLRRTPPIARIAALLAVLADVVVAALILLGGPGKGYTVKARFQNASQLVKGNLVQVAGQPVGKVSSIDLTPDR